MYDLDLHDGLTADQRLRVADWAAADAQTARLRRQIDALRLALADLREDNEQLRDELQRLRGQRDPRRLREALFAGSQAEQAETYRRLQTK